MKNLISLLVVIMAFNSSYSQQDCFKTYELNSIQGGHGRAGFEYNTNMQKKIMLYEKQDQNQVYQPVYKYIYGYNSFDKPDSSVYLIWKNGEWVIYGKKYYFYDNKGNEIKYLNLNLNTETMIIDTSSATETKYDSKGNVTEITDRTKTSANGWNFANKVNYDYTPTNKIMSQIYSKWENNVWLYTTKFYKTYNNYDSLLTDSAYKWSIDAWIYSNVDNYYYDDQKNLKMLESQYFNENKWYKFEKYEYKYDEQRRRIESVRSATQTDEWFLSSKENYNYSVNGKIEYKETFIYDEDKWKNNNLTEYQYDNNYNNTKIILTAWIDDAWTNISKYIYVYAGINKIINAKYQTWINGEWKNQDAVLTVSDGKYTYKPSGYEINLEWLSTSAEDLYEIPNLIIYPNPAGDFIELSTCNKGLNPFVDIADVRIFDMFGIEVLSTLFASADTPKEGNFRLDVSGLKVGVYFIKTGNRIEKFLKK